MDISTPLTVLATASWVVAAAVIGYAIFRASRGFRVKAAPGLIIGAIVLALVLTGLSAGLVFVQPEERGVVISAVSSGGYRDVALEPGLHWVVPFAEQVVMYPISKQTYTMSIAPLEGQIQGDDSVAARTSDGQEVLIDASVIYAVDPDKVIEVHIHWQTRYTNDLVRPLSRGIIRDEAAEYGVEEIISSKREELIQGIREHLATTLAENGLTLEGFVLRNITFSPEYAASVEQKQIAEQQAQQAAFVVEQRRQEAEQAREVAKGLADAEVTAAEGRAQARLIEAQAEAQALLLIADALRDNPDLLIFEYISKLAPGIQVMLVPSDNPYLLPLPALEPQPIETP
ncbi:MAG: prohibitin family protein [Anaerolineales bacterium]|jgi:regulator of protease activity HflC (stomatin/prohibitin superfamily)